MKSKIQVLNWVKCKGSRSKIKRIQDKENKIQISFSSLC